MLSCSGWTHPSKKQRRIFRSPKPPPHSAGPSRGASAPSRDTMAFSVMYDCAEELSRVMDSKISGSDGCVEVFQPFCNLATDFGLQFFAGARTDVQRDNEAAQALCKAARQSVGQFGSAALLLLSECAIQ
ncbi:hypothetical protein HPB51_018370 [Rhipicephalus microplus]|uniref:Uncharacterized protein n=1 Tax=Rhipicephalus microplus TaxID=6941 RepID=A0A9J6EUA9_RHIMP|nr:hypothetical protein HPB51_018370 [Rhipicephalus microplus]